jgi:hypothetical protein
MRVRLTRRRPLGYGRGTVSDPPIPDPELGFGTRLWFAFACFFRVLLDGAFARRAYGVRAALPGPKAELPAREVAPAVASEPASEPASKVEKAPTPAPTPAPEPNVDAALQLLALFQREGRLIDFLEEDVATFSDAEVGAAARVVHQGCRKALRDHATVAPVRGEAEGGRVRVPKGTPPSEVRLVGNVVGEPPFEGRLVHRGWRVGGLHLPTAIDGHDVTVVAAAEVEL